MFLKSRERSSSTRKELSSIDMYCGGGGPILLWLNFLSSDSLPRGEYLCRSWTLRMSLASSSFLYFFSESK